MTLQWNSFQMKVNGLNITIEATCPICGALLPFPMLPRYRYSVDGHGQVSLEIEYGLSHDCKKTKKEAA